MFLRAESGGAVVLRRSDGGPPGGTGDAVAISRGTGRRRLRHRDLDRHGVRACIAHAVAGSLSPPARAHCRHRGRLARATALQRHEPLLTSPNEPAAHHHPWTSYVIVPLFALARRGHRDRRRLPRAGRGLADRARRSRRLRGRQAARRRRNSLAVTRRLRPTVGWGAVAGAGAAPRRLPLADVHPHAELAALASEAAADQGAFWRMHDRLLEHQDKLRWPIWRRTPTDSRSTWRASPTCEARCGEADRPGTGRARPDRGVSGTSSPSSTGAATTARTTSTPCRAQSAPPRPRQAGGVVALTCLARLQAVLAIRLHPVSRSTCCSRTVSSRCCSVGGSPTRDLVVALRRCAPASIGRLARPRLVRRGGQAVARLARTICGSSRQGRSRRSPSTKKVGVASTPALRPPSMSARTRSRNVCSRRAASVSAGSSSSRPATESRSSCENRPRGVRSSECASQNCPVQAGQLGELRGEVRSRMERRHGEVAPDEAEAVEAVQE